MPEGPRIGEVVRGAWAEPDPAFLDRQRQGVGYRPRHQAHEGRQTFEGMTIVEAAMLGRRTHHQSAIEAGHEVTAMRPNDMVQERPLGRRGHGQHLPAHRLHRHGKAWDERGAGAPGPRAGSQNDDGGGDPATLGFNASDGTGFDDDLPNRLVFPQGSAGLDERQPQRFRDRPVIDLVVEPAVECAMEVAGKVPFEFEQVLPLDPAPATLVPVPAVRQTCVSLRFLGRRRKEERPFLAQPDSDATRFLQFRDELEPKLLAAVEEAGHRVGWMPRLQPPRELAGRGPAGPAAGRPRVKQGDGAPGFAELPTDAEADNAAAYNENAFSHPLPFLRALDRGIRL